MCASCACGTPNDNHGDSRNITLDQLQSAADAARISLAEAGDNLAEAALEGDESSTSDPEAKESKSA